MQPTEEIPPLAPEGQRRKNKIKLVVTKSQGPEGAPSPACPCPQPRTPFQAPRTVCPRPINTTAGPVPSSPQLCPAMGPTKPGPPTMAWPGLTLAWSWPQGYAQSWGCPSAPLTAPLLAGEVGQARAARPYPATQGAATTHSPAAPWHPHGRAKCYSSRVTNLAGRALRQLIPSSLQRRRSHYPSHAAAFFFFFPCSWHTG